MSPNTTPRASSSSKRRRLKRLRRVHSQFPGGRSRYVVNGDPCVQRYHFPSRCLNSLRFHLHPADLSIGDRNSIKNLLLECQSRCCRVLSATLLRKDTSKQTRYPFSLFSHYGISFLPRSRSSEQRNTIGRRLVPELLSR